MIVETAHAFVISHSLINLLSSSSTLDQASSNLVNNHNVQAPDMMDSYLSAAAAAAYTDPEGEAQVRVGCVYLTQ